MFRLLCTCVFVLQAFVLQAQSFQTFDLEAQSMANPRQMQRLNGKVVFWGYTDAYGEELWAFDSATQSVSLLKDIWAGSQSSTQGFTEYIIFQGKMYFAADDSTHGVELWVSDGTPAGTQLLKDIATGADSSFPGNFFIFNNQLFFTAETPNEGRELWVTNGTPAGTQLLKDIFPGSDGSYPIAFTACNNKLYFSAYDNLHGAELWVSDGTAAGTQLVKDLTNDTQDGFPYYPFGPICLNNKLIFVGQDVPSDQELWISDGTPAGTHLLKDIQPGTNSSYISYFTLLNNLLFFTADDGTHGQELWVTDGTTLGTNLVMDIRSGANTSNPQNLFAADSILLFAAENSNNNLELWKTNGNQTSLLKNISSVGSSYPERFFTFQNKIFFSAENASSGKELYVTDGTTAGTQLFKDLNTNAMAGSYPHSFTIHNNELYFIADTGPINNENYQLFKSDGTPSGTNILTPQTTQNPFNSFFFPFDLLSTPFGLFMKAAFDSNAGFELWRWYDPTSATSSLKTSHSLLRCYPNPYKDFVLCECQKELPVILYTLEGKRIFETTLKAGTNKLTVPNLSQPLILQSPEHAIMLLPQHNK